MVSGVFGMFFIHKKGLPHFILVRQPLFCFPLIAGATSDILSKLGERMRQSKPRPKRYDKAEEETTWHFLRAAEQL